MISKIHKLSVVVFFVFVLVGCIPSENKEKADKGFDVVKGEIGGEYYYVPKDYFKIKGRYFADNNIYLIAMYPDFTPLTKKPQELWEEKQWYRNLRIIGFKGNLSIDFDEFAKKNIENLKAYETIGEEYGLIHNKQPEPYVQDHYDIWLEKQDEKYTTFITCTEQLTESSVPQCKQHFFLDENLRLRISFDKRLLPHWKNIKEKTIKMFESFESEEAARAYISKKLRKTETTNHGGQR